MELILHIGCEKTGTSSLQMWLHQNAAALAARNIVYSRAMGRPNNRRLSLYGIEAGRYDEWLAVEKVFSAEDHLAFKERVRGEFTLEVQAARAAGCTRFFISNEHLQSRCFQPGDVERVHDLLAPLFDHIQVYCFLRPAVDVCLSLTSTIARNGVSVTREWLDGMLKPSAPYFDLGKMLQRWAECFGKASVTPVAFKRHPDVIRYFEDLLGLLDRPALPRQRSYNEALDYRVIAMCNAMQLKSFHGTEVNQHRRFFVNDMPVEERLNLDRPSAQALSARFDEANAALCAEWPEITVEDLTPDWKRYPEVSNFDQLGAIDTFGPFLRYMVERFNSETWMAQARMSAACCERDQMLGKLDHALQFCDAGITAARNAAKHEHFRDKAERLTENLAARRLRLQDRIKRQAAATAARDPTYVDRDDGPAIESTLPNPEDLGPMGPQEIAASAA